MILAGVVAAGVGSMFLVEGRLTTLFPEVLAAAGLIGFAWCLLQVRTARRLTRKPGSSWSVRTRGDLI